MKALDTIKRWQTRGGRSGVRGSFSTQTMDQSFNYPDRFVTSAPSPQNTLDIFRGEWASQLPPPFADLKAGHAGLFDDARVTWFLQEAGGVEGRSVVELGPLEGGHSHMLERHGAREIVAIEANTRAYLKCLIIKELLDLRRVRFLCGDFVEYLRVEGPSFDVCLANGVLYHMQNPAELIALIAARCTQSICMWTHYYDRDILRSHPVHSNFPGVARESEHQGFRHTLHRHEYGVAVRQGGFCGGTAPFSHWMSREDILRCLNFFGFHDVRVSFEEPNHQNGPAFALTAIRTGPAPAP